MISGAAWELRWPKKNSPQLVLVTSTPNLPKNSFGHHLGTLWWCMTSCYSTVFPRFRVVFFFGMTLTIKKIKLSSKTMFFQTWFYWISTRTKKKSKSFFLLIFQPCLDSKGRCWRRGWWCMRSELMPKCSTFDSGTVSVRIEKNRQENKVWEGILIFLRKQTSTKKIKWKNETTRRHLM